MGFLSVTKYPPSVAFLLLTLGLTCCCCAPWWRWTRAAPAGCARWAVFGRSALFFYLAHLWLLGLVGLAFQQGAGLGALYGVWALALVPLYAACLRWDRFKRGKPETSFWRML